MCAPIRRPSPKRFCNLGLAAGLDLSELPVPRLIVLKLARGAPLDASALRQTLTDKVSGATLDDHRLWLSRLAVMANTVVIVAVVIFLLVLVAMMLAVGFATRGAMAGNREIIEVLHFVGAADQFISRQFQNHFFRLGLRGGGIGRRRGHSRLSGARHFIVLVAGDAGGRSDRGHVRQFRAGVQRLSSDRAHRGGHSSDDRSRVARHRVPAFAAALLAVHRRPPHLGRIPERQGFNYAAGQELSVTQ